MDSRNEVTSGSNNSCDTGATHSKITGRIYSRSPSSRKIPGKRNHEELTVQTTHGKRAKDNMGGKENDGPSSRRPSTRYATCPQQGTRLHQTRATPHGRKGQ